MRLASCILLAGSAGIAPANIRSAAQLAEWLDEVRFDREFSRASDGLDFSANAFAVDLR
jgi:hypothetical protein